MPTTPALPLLALVIAVTAACGSSPKAAPAPASSTSSSAAAITSSAAPAATTASVAPTVAATTSISMTDADLTAVGTPGTVSPSEHGDDLAYATEASVCDLDPTTDDARVTTHEVGAKIGAIVVVDEVTAYKTAADAQTLLAGIRTGIAACDTTLSHSDDGTDNVATTFAYVGANADMMNVPAAQNEVFQEIQTSAEGKLYRTVVVQVSNNLVDVISVIESGAATASGEQLAGAVAVRVGTRLVAAAKG